MGVHSSGHQKVERSSVLLSPCQTGCDYATVTITYVYSISYNYLTQQRVSLISRHAPIPSFSYLMHMHLRRHAQSGQYCMPVHTSQVTETDDSKYIHTK